MLQNFPELKNDQGFVLLQVMSPFSHDGGTVQCPYPYQILYKSWLLVCFFRDLKPANVLLGEDDTPVLMDFGSMAVARVEINGASQARALTVGHSLSHLDRQFPENLFFGQAKISMKNIQF